MTHTNKAVPDFNNLGIATNLLAVLAEQKFTSPTPIQRECIPVVLAGKDIVGIAQTGTGKTLAFGLPIIQRLATTNGQALIILPTRELAIQVEEVMQKLGGKLGLRTVVIIGGAHMDRQKRSLRQNPHVVIATPGRLIDHIQQKNFSLQHVKIIVLDEADRMLDIGFAPQIKQILSLASPMRQTLLFSATMPTEIVKIANQYMKEPVRVEVAPAGTSATNVKQEAYIVSKECKMQLLEKHLADHSGTVLVFSRTKHGAKKYTRSINEMGHTAVEIHSDRSLSQRKAAMEGFKNGKFRVLVATDIASRGIDVNNISLVVNYDLPDNPEDYVHRIGRTGRAGNSGKAVSFVAPDERRDVLQIERLIRKPLQVMPLPVLPPRRTVAHVSSGYEGGRGFGRNRRSEQRTRRKW
ncbi:MAG: DEAD/DEAH box helicase domain protein [Candidatus Magasanikbacteria bacterium GW2011_GWA2_37_8]|uniref:DEAD/DEAH box helicase domain protein n=1 Tax=Candidatus Magasanikbacteria bacterium GW2011_GWA2_37_8 TaxID=1619036 RepID=A0A0G0HFL2_9BACT|nr:MAG: DEAD/DEAH box helicase domain protein [Candidatus Magasanikbacteria bacterium GW2011_GWA2_37_8]